MFSFRTLSALLFFCLTPSHHAAWFDAVVLNIQELESGLDTGLFELLVDVRPQFQWDQGHLPNATHVPGLAGSIEPAALLEGCEYCTIAVYCNQGGLAAAAIRRLRLAGFKGVLYNGLGTEQWERSDRVLVNTTSLEPKCTCSEDDWSMCRDSGSMTCDTLGGSGYMMRSDGTFGNGCRERCVRDRTVGFRKRTGWACGTCP